MCSACRRGTTSASADSSSHFEATARTVVSAVNGVERSQRDDADRLSATTSEVASLYEVLIAPASPNR